MASREDFEAAGLFDAEIDSETGRLELLEWLDERGFSVAQMVSAHGRLALGSLAGDAKLGSDRRLPSAEAIAVSGLDPAHFASIATAFGFTREQSGEFGLTQSEAETLSIFTGLAVMFSEEEAQGFVRVIGSSLARIAEASVSLFLTDVEGPLLASKASELELAKKVLEAVELLDGFVPLLDPVLRRHVLQAVERGRRAMIDDIQRLEYRYAVGFVDLVGFTPISQGMSARELGTFLRRFEAKAHDAVTKVGARLVKLIGDEVMFVAPDADTACKVAQMLMTDVAIESGGDVAPRGGLAYGEVLVRGGDYYGAVVNLASRLVDEAVPRELLVTEPLAENTSYFDFEPGGRRMLKGFADPIVVQSVLFSAPSGPID